MKKKLLDIQLHFDQEKRMRLKFEDRSKALEAKLQKLSNHVIDQETVVSIINLPFSYACTISLSLSLSLALYHSLCNFSLSLSLSPHYNLHLCISL